MFGALFAGDQRPRLTTQVLLEHWRDMATIHRLETKHARQQSPSRGADISGRPGAEIILFPGVRYERWTEANQATTVRSRRTSGRDRLDASE
jgi:hypothetical protein